MPKIKIVKRLREKQQKEAQNEKVRKLRFIRKQQNQEGNKEDKIITPSDLHLPVFVMTPPLHAEFVINNEWMEELAKEGKVEINIGRMVYEWHCFYQCLAQEGIVMTYPTVPKLQDLHFINSYVYLPHILDKRVCIISRFRAKGRDKEEAVAFDFLTKCGYECHQPPAGFYFEGEPDCRYIRDNYYVGGYGERSTREALEWIEKNFDCRIFKIGQTTGKLFHTDCLALPITPWDVLVATKHIADKDELRELEKVVNVIPIEDEGLLEFGIMNSVVVGYTVYTADLSESFSRNSDEYKTERKKRETLCKIANNLGLEVVFIPFDEFTLQGALLSCYDQETEVLTDKGWKYFKDLKGDELIAAYNPETQNIEYLKPVAYQAYEYEGKFYHIKTSHVDLLITADHNVYIKTQFETKKYGEFKLVEIEKFLNDSTASFWFKQAVENYQGKDEKYFILPALEVKEEDWGNHFYEMLEKEGKAKSINEELGKKLINEYLNGESVVDLVKKYGIAQKTIKKYFIEKGIKKRYLSNADKKYLKERQIPMDLWVQFLGWYLAEGCLFKSSRPFYAIHIGQDKNKNPGNYRKIATLLTKMGLNWSYCEKNISFTIYDKQLYNYLEKFGKAPEKYIPTEIKNLDKKYLHLLLEALVEGDGCKRKDWLWEFNTSSKQLADDVQEIAIKCGYRAIIRKYDRKGKKFKIRENEKERTTNHDIYRVIINLNKNKTLISRNKDRHNIEVFYDKKMVYDVTLPKYHILIVRRNGKPCLSGNCVTARLNWIDRFLQIAWKEGSNSLAAAQINRKLASKMKEDLDEKPYL